MKRGDVCLVRLPAPYGSELSKTRPCIIVQNDKGNYYSPTTIILPITHKKNDNLPTHVSIEVSSGVVYKDSTILGEAIRAIDKKRILKKIGRVSEETMREIDKAIRTSLALGD